MNVLGALLMISALLWFQPSFLRPEYGIVLMGILLGTVTGRVSQVRALHKELGLLMVLGVAGIATIMAQILAGYIFIWRDAMVTLMLGYYAAVLVFVSMVSGKSTNYTGAWIFGLTLSAVITAISIFQYFNLLNINSFLLPASGVAGWLRADVYWKRTVGTMGNPNYWGFVISIVLALSTYALFWRARLICLPLFFGLLISLILTGSRSALISWIAGTTIGGIVLAFAAREVPKAGVSAVAALILVVGVFGLELSNHYQNKARFSVTNVDTLIGRMTVWKQAWQTTSQDFRTLLLGQGPQKGIDTLHWGDNSYIKMFKEYGVVSLVLYLTLLAVMMQRTLRRIRTQTGDGKTWAIVLFFILVQWVVFELSADTWFFVRVCAPVLALYAFVIAKPEDSETSPSNSDEQSRLASTEVLGRVSCE